MLFYKEFLTVAYYFSDTPDITVDCKPLQMIAMYPRTFLLKKRL